MIQFKERPAASIRPHPLPTYPILMAADILLYDTDGSPWATTSNTWSWPATTPRLTPLRPRSPCPGW